MVAARSDEHRQNILHIPRMIVKEIYRLPKKYTKFSESMYFVLLVLHIFEGG